MYSLEKKFSGMYHNPLPGFPLQFRCREHIRNIDVRQTATAAGKMDIHVVTMDGRLGGRRLSNLLVSGVVML